MKKALLLGILSLFNGLGQDDPRFFEQELTLEEGVFQIETSDPWTSVTLFSKDGSPLPPIWYENNHGEMVRWHHTEENASHNESWLDLLIKDKASHTLTIKTESQVDLVGHFYNTEVFGEDWLVFDAFDDDSKDDPLTGLPKTVQKPRFISRAQWGADESLRVLRSFHQFFRSASGKTWFQTEIEQVSPDFRPVVTSTKNAQGEPLYWPLSKSPQIAKFVIHHTGEYVTQERNPKEIMRSIYYFHTITRGWGDIGYNYVIDKRGNIYEGRAGGPNSVGAHTAYHNIGSIGVSLMGNFQHEKPTEAQIKVLSLLLGDHVRRFNINPHGKSLFLGTNSYNIAGHRDVARPGHGTACPGIHLYRLLPKIREEAAYIAQSLRRQEKNSATIGKDFLSKSSAAPQVQKVETTQPKKPEDNAPVTLAKIVTKKLMQRGETETADIVLRNHTDEMWPKGLSLTIRNLPDGLLATKFRSVEPIGPDRSGIFRGKLYAKNVPNGVYHLDLVPEFLERYNVPNPKQFTFYYPLQISGNVHLLTAKNIQDVSKNLSTSLISPYQQNGKQKPTVSKKYQAPTQASVSHGPPIKIKLSYFDEHYADIQALDSPLDIIEGNKLLASFPAGTSVRVLSRQKDSYSYLLIRHGEEEWTSRGATFRTEGILEIENYDRGIKGKNRYNRFRRQINVHVHNGKLLLVNELPLEEYLWGLAEEPSSEPEQKKHAIHILARSYGLVYLGKKRKFHTSLYDLEDSPATSQFYLGYDWERYHADQKKLIAQTHGQVITYNNVPAIGPYFTQSSGENSCKWKKAYPWTKCQKLPFDERLETKGHGVGLSGNSARVLAEQGKNFKEILDYFFEDIEIKRVY